MNIFKKSTLVAATILSTALVLPAHGQMFENAQRHNPLPGQGQGMVQLNIAHGSGKIVCGAFFVSNRGNKPYIMTARHCAEYEMAKACREGRVTFTTQAGKVQGVCKSALIETPDLDETLLLGEFPNWDSDVRPNIQFYSLSSQRPRVNTPLQMMGYPGDTERKAAFTVTDHCWISGDRMVNIYDYPEQQNVMRKSFTAIAVSTNWFGMLKHRWAAFHNCSVYGGNSGGPILKEGTNIVLGLPTSFFPNATKIQPQTLTSSMDSTVDFMERNRETLNQLGVSFAKPYHGGSYIPPYELLQDSWGRQACYPTNQVNSGNAKAVASVFCEL